MLALKSAPMDTPDTLVARARDGDRAAFGALHQQYARSVHAVVLGLVPAQHADDVTQEVFLVALDRLAELRDEGRFGPWLHQIARNRARDHLRRRRTVVPLPDDLSRPRTPSAEARQVLDALRQLPEAYREPLIMRLVEGMTGPEIAARTGHTPGSVRVNLHRGMKLLRQRLGAT